MKRRRSEAETDDPRFTFTDLRMLAGIALLLFFCVMMTTVPALFFSAWHRDGYQRIDAELVSRASTRTVRLRIAESEIDVAASRFDNLAQQPRQAVWFNPAARADVLGARAFDQRVLAVSRHPQPPGLIGTGLALLLSLAALTLASYLLGPARPRGALRRASSPWSS